MTAFFIALLLSLVILPTQSLQDWGSISWTASGSATSSHIAGGNGGVTVSGSKVSLLQQWAPRVYLMTSNGATFYRFPNLLGHSIQFTIDLSTSTCSCNAALYFIQMPQGVTNDYYCDAQGSTSSTRCAEIDIMEANTHAFQSTVHCNAGTQPCQWGCGINWRPAAGFGPGGSVIDTRSPFQVDFSFVQSSSGQLQTISIKVSQSGRKLTHNLDDAGCSSLQAGYISGLTNAIKSGQLVMAISYWGAGSGMDWLDGCSSGQTCPASSTAIFQNIKLLSTISAIDSELPAVVAENNAFVGSGGFYAMIALFVVLFVAILVFVIKKIVESKASEIV